MTLRKTIGAYNQKEQAVVELYNKMTGRKIKHLPAESRVIDALDAFDIEDFERTFMWAQDDYWCKTNNIFKTRVGWVCSYNVVAEHSDYERPEQNKIGGGSWTLEQSK